MNSGDSVFIIAIKTLCSNFAIPNCGLYTFSCDTVKIVWRQSGAMCFLAYSLRIVRLFIFKSFKEELL